ncbi:MAG: diguanylate cyclase, partial [Acidobacteria bacterium]|nr:diguanylate cyclase [Acidobacteriota bacterium]
MTCFKPLLRWSVAIWASVLSASPAATELANLSHQFRQPFDEADTLISPVRHITQDSNGFVWFAQRRGLRRYDGLSLTEIERSNSSPISSLATGVHGDLWLGTESRGLSRWDAKRGVAAGWNQPVEGVEPDSRITALATDVRGRVWIATSAGGVSRLNAATLESRFYPSQQIDPSALESLRITALFATSDGRVWLGSVAGRLYSFDPTSESFQRVRLPANLGDVTVIVEGSEEHLWAGTRAGELVRVDRSSLTGDVVISWAGALPEDDNGSIRALAEDPQGHVWIGTERGLKVLAPGSAMARPVGSNPEHPGEPSTEPVHALLLDRSAVLWVAAGDGGIATTSTRAGAFSQWRIDHHGASAPIMALAEGPDRSLWAGTHRAGLFRRFENGSLRHYGSKDATPQDTSATALLFDRRHRLWIGTLQKGLSVLDIDTETFRHYRGDPGRPGSLNNDTVTSLFEDREGRILVGTYYGGLNVLDPDTETFRALEHDAADPSSLSENDVRSILEDSQGRLWVGTAHEGLNLRTTATAGFRHFKHAADDPGSLADNAVVTIAEDRSGRIWVGTHLGLHRVVEENDRVSFERIGTESALRGVKVFSVTEDADGNLWLSTSQGISRLDPRTGKVVNLGRDHGLPPGGFSFGAHATTSAGLFVYGSKYGVTTFDPTKVSLEPYSPKIVLTGVATKGLPTEKPHADSWTLRHGDDVISFEFSLLDFIATHRNRYEHLLEGFDEDWIDLGNHTRATYSNLPPGRYTFRVRGTNSEGVWSAEDATLALRVLPPFWATWWAYALYVAAAFALALAYVRHQARKQQLEAQYTHRLEREVDRRTTELAEQNAKLRYANELLEVASVTDSLTGVRNRRFLLTTIEQDIALVDRSLANDPDDTRQDSAFVFILFDLDGFKEINDSYGHSAGDLVLFQIRDLLNQACRSSDTLIRWGGDEFLIVAREATRAHVEALAERIRQSVADHLFDIGTSAPVQLTCSLGFACYPFVPSSFRLYSWEEVIDIADRALYVAKRHGPNMWAGIFGTKQTQETPPEDLLDMIRERPELLDAEGSIRLVTSRPTHLQPAFHPTTST